MQIRQDDLTGPEIHALLEEHLQHMRAVSPPQSKHALDLDGLRQPDIRFWSAWDGEQLIGCGALKRLDPRHGELKSMRCAPDRRRQGIGRQMLVFIVGQAGVESYYENLLQGIRGEQTVKVFRFDGDVLRLGQRRRAAVAGGDDQLLQAG